MAGIPDEPPPPYPGLPNDANKYGGFQGGGTTYDGYPNPPSQQQMFGTSPTPTPIVTQPQITVLQQQYRDLPVQTICPSCHAQIITSLDYEIGTFTYMICAILCLVGCSEGCCLIPFCVDSCKDVTHKCPNCEHTLAQWNRF